MQAGRPYKDRLFPSSQLNRAIPPVSHFRQFCSLPLKGRVREGLNQGIALLI